MVAPGPEGFIDRLPEPDGLPDWISQDELDHYVGEFTRTGFTGGLNWYRNFDRNWETTAELAGATISCRRCSSPGRPTRCCHSPAPTGLRR